ncbi:MAG: hypothetical protein IT463_07960 [Planctomycetes bacterium]|nr:hypothetical protein [Planctomycetota bacterium]
MTRTSEYLERLRFLTGRFSQAEIARKTGTQRNNVSRYLRGARMPLEFAAGLVRALGVNPAWLLAGEGTPFLADVNTTTQRTAADLLDLVAAMNSVAQMQLGSLTGKHHLKVLRELSDALGRFQELKADLNRRTAPIFKQILDDYWKALDRWELERAEDIRRAAEQVAKLCDDDALNARHERTLSYHAFLRRDEDAAIRHQLRLFQRTLPQGALLDEAAVREACNLANSLQSVGRMQEALALCDGVLAMSRQRGTGWPARLFLQALSGYVQLELGDAREALRRVTSAMPQPDPRLLANQQSMLVRALLMTGACTFAQACELGDFGPAHAQGMITWAVWLENAPDLSLALQRYGAVVGSDFHSAQAKALLAALKPGGRQAGPGRPAATGPAPYNERFDRAIFATQLARVQGRKAGPLLAEAVDLLAGKPAEVDMSMLALGVHHRNLLALAGKNTVQAAAARRWFAERVAAGYGCYAALAAAPK